MKPSRPHPLLTVLSLFLVLSLLGGFFAIAFQSLHWEWRWDAVWAYREKFFYGWCTTLL
ncbi:MAG: amino acid ABC transporter permease, partial [Verrucomicrobia bacterium]|nr:amino acid ABC transporter permease [Verrucomicrobiota bacterium]